MSVHALRSCCSSSTSIVTSMIQQSARRLILGHKQTRPFLFSNRLLFSTDHTDPKNTTPQPALVKLDIPTHSKVATLILNRPPVNSLSMEMCTAISSAIKSIEESHPHIQALVLSSSNGSVFSAGLDLMELYNAPPERLDRFWTSFQQLFIDLYGSKLATIAAIQGHALAAGCMIAMACDYRIMTSHASTTIGLNEAKFGIVAPAFMGQLMIQTIGYRQAEKALSLGTIFTPQEALDIGLVDQVVVAPAADCLLDTCHSVALEWAKIPSKARVASKHMARKALLDTFTTSRQEDLQFFREYIMTESVQQGLGKYLESIKRKK